MASKKLYDIAARVGEYTDPATGEPRPRYQTVGALMEGSNGGIFIRLSRWFNPAGVVGENGQKESVILSCFEPKNRGDL